LVASRRLDALCQPIVLSHDFKHLLFDDRTLDLLGFVSQSRGAVTVFLRIVHPQW